MKQEKRVTYVGNIIRLSADFQPKLSRPEDSGRMLKLLRGKNVQPRIFHPARLSFRFEGEINS